MEKFFAHIDDPAPGFRCYRPDSSSDQEFEQDIRLEHRLGTPASSEMLARLLARLGNGSEEFESLYSRHNGMVLYVCGDDAGIHFSSIEGLDEFNSEWRIWFEDMEEDELWEFQKHGVAFAEICASGNYFVWWEGKVYYSNHDGGDDDPFGDSLSEFLDRIAANPAQFLYDAGCYTCYTPAQWTPGEYVADMQAP
jgi:hypothetical protein